jgi:cation diffusion facilitator family transporter
MKFSQKQIAMSISLGVSVLMLVGKLSAYYVTGSTAILSDAAESVIHIFATGIATFSLWYADRPPDESHPYGHGKVSFFSVGFEGFLIFSAAIYIIFEAVSALIYGPELRRLDLGLIIIAALSVVNLVLGVYLIRVGKKAGSQVLVANGQHVITDMKTSAAVVVGVLLVWLTEIMWLDPVVAIIAAFQILYTGGTLMRDAVGVAMDQVKEEDTEKIRGKLNELATKGVISGYHQLRHRRVDNLHWIEVHMLVPGDLTVNEAHERITKSEKVIESLFKAQDVRVTTHIEPDDHERAHPGGHYYHDPLIKS